MSYAGFLEIVRHGFSHEFMEKNPITVAFWSFFAGSFTLVLGIQLVFKYKKADKKTVYKSVKAWFYVVLGFFLVLLSLFRLLGN